MCRHDLSAYVMARTGAVLVRDKGRNPRPIDRDGAILEFHLKLPDGVRVVVWLRADRTWSFVILDGGSTNGRIWNFVQWLDGETYSGALHRLRRELATHPGEEPAPVPVIAAAARPALAQTLARFSPTLSDADVAAATLAWTRWNAGPNAYLGRRGLTAATQAMFAAEIRTPEAGGLGAVAFALRTQEERLAGYSLKGPAQGCGASFARNSRGSAGLPVRFGIRPGLARLYVAEAPIDGLSLWQIDEAGAAAGVLASTGQFARAAQAALFCLSGSAPPAEVHLAVDNDGSGDGFRRIIGQTLAAAGFPEERIFDRRPPAPHKDWNEVLMHTRQSEGVDDGSHGG